MSDVEEEFSDDDRGEDEPEVGTGWVSSCYLQLNSNEIFIE